MNLTKFEVRRGHREVTRRIAQIRRDGFFVTVVKEFGGFVAVIEISNGAGDCERVMIDPLRVVERCLMEAA